MSDLLNPWKVVRKDEEVQIQINTDEKLAILDMAPCPGHDTEKMCLKCIPILLDTLQEVELELHAPEPEGLPLARNFEIDGENACREGVVVLPQTHRDLKSWIYIHDVKGPIPDIDVFVDFMKDHSWEEGGKQHIAFPKCPDCEMPMKAIMRYKRPVVEGCPLSKMPAMPKPHKHDWCPCGSRKKYGKCCGKVAQ